MSGMPKYHNPNFDTTVWETHGLPGDEDRQPDHILKTWPRHFEGVKRGVKRFEVRRDDRGFRVGDLLLLREWNPDSGEFTGRGAAVEVTYKLNGGAFGVEDGYCVLGVEPR